MAGLPPLSEHLLRRAGFGVGAAETALFNRFTYMAVVEQIVDYDPAASDVDSHLGTPGYVGITTRGVVRAQHRRSTTRGSGGSSGIVHSPAPLQEKMALFWHHHFATAYSKVSSVVGDDRRRAHDGGQAVGGSRRAHAGRSSSSASIALGNFRDLLIEVAKDPAMLVWLDGRLNTKAKPQENFGRELMELFTFGVENYVETDVYAAARVFTRLEPGDDRHARHGVGVLRLQLRCRRSTIDRARNSAFRSIPMAARRIPARNAANGHAGRDRSDQRPGHSSGDGAAARAASSGCGSSSETAAPDDDFVASDRRHVPAERHQHEGRRARRARVADQFWLELRSTALLVAGGVRRARR